MDQQKLTELLHLQKQEIANTTPFCPSGHEVAALFDGNRDDADYERFERHLADCGFCQARTAVLARIQQDTDDEQLPEALLVAANQFGDQPRQGRVRRAPPWAAAALVVIALFAIAGRDSVLNNGAIDQPPITNSPGEDARLVRNIGRPDPGPTVLAPIDGESMRADQLTVRWTGVSGSLYYDVRLVNAEGFIVWQNRVKETQSMLPANLGLVSGDRYFVRVDAYLAEAKSVSSPHVKFTIERDD